MITAKLLAELERANVRLMRDGDGLRIDAPQDFDLSPWLPKLKEWKPALLAALDWHEAVTVAKGFDRERADMLYARLVTLEHEIAMAPG